MKNILSAIFVIVITGVNPSHAFKLDPSSKPDSSGLYIKRFFEPIHENLTFKAVNAAQIVDSLKNDATFLSEIIRGVRWNDDPLSMAKRRPQDFYIYYKDSCRRSEEVDPSWDMFYRTHCGDMQFLHAMASKKNENAGETSDLMLMWAEFSYRVAIGDIDKDLRFRSIGVKLGKRSAELFSYVMTHNETRMKWQPEWLFTLDCKRGLTLDGILNGERPTKLKCKGRNNQYSPETIQNIALGSLLHLLQDSFSGSHVLREGNTVIGVSRLNGVGKINRFGIYNAQDDKAHGHADLNIEDKHEHGGLSLTDISARLIELVINQRESRKNSWGEAEKDSWGEAEKILKSVFEVSNRSEKPSDIGYPKTKRSSEPAKAGR